MSLSRIGNRGHVNDPIVRPLRRRNGLGLRKRSTSSFLARPQSSIPQVDEFGIACLQRVEPEPFGVVGQALAIQLLDQRVHAGTRLPWRTRQPAGEEHVVLGFEALHLGFQYLDLRLKSGATRPRAIIVPRSRLQHVQDARTIVNSDSCPARDAAPLRKSWRSIRRRGSGRASAGCPVEDDGDRDGQRDHADAGTARAAPAPLSRSAMYIMTTTRR